MLLFNIYDPEQNRLNIFNAVRENILQSLDGDLAHYS